jgi:hypothetical protein
LSNLLIKIDQERKGVGSSYQQSRLAEALAELERQLVGVAIQGTVARMGEVSLLAFDPAKGSADLVDLSATTDIKLAQLAAPGPLSVRERARSSRASRLSLRARRPCPLGDQLTNFDQIEHQT